jgi:hypothetical protein
VGQDVAAQLQAVVPESISSPLFNMSLLYLPVPDDNITDLALAAAVSFTSPKGVPGTANQSGTLPDIHDGQFHLVRVLSSAWEAGGGGGGVAKGNGHAKRCAMYGMQALGASLVSNFLAMLVDDNALNVSLSSNGTIFDLHFGTLDDR